MPKNIIAEAIEDSDLIDNRFRGAVWVNTPDKDGNKPGFFSLIFRAHDIVEDRQVALKFLDTTTGTSPYRQAAFEREPEILKDLIGHNRCLQLVAGISTHTVNITTAQGDTLPVSCRFFATEWLDQGLEEFFLDQQRIEARAKIRIFTDIVQSIEALHRANIHHRDIKPDNLKVRVTNSNKITIAIDFGTAARSISPPLLDNYEFQVGDQRYSSPESFCGLAGHRQIAKYTDLFGLGCILYELFDYREYWKVYLDNITTQQIILYLQAATHKTQDVDLRLNAYITALTPLKRAAPQPNLEREKSTAPACIINLLNNVIAKLTAFDYRQREINLDKIRRTLRAMTTVIDNTELQAQILAKKRILREQRKRKMLENRRRLENMR